MHSFSPAASPESLALFHASKHEFDFPDIGHSAANRENHANGALGLWVATQPDWIGEFGPHLYEVRVTGKVLDVPIDQFSRWGGRYGVDARDDYFAQRRQELLEAGVSYIRVVELDGRSDMGVVVDLAAIEQFKRLQGQHSSDCAREERPRM